MGKNISSIQKVAILGSGTMGSQIAAHCVNAGLKVWLLDLKDEGEDPNRRVKENIQNLAKINPSPLGLSSDVECIRPGNFSDDLNVLAEADWICEAIVEDLDIKRQLMNKIEEHRRSHCIVTTNTSGLSVNKIAEECSTEFKEHFLGTHFFNPPRYMKLLELIPGANSSPDTVDLMRRFGEKVLGKGVVVCKDTPNFIANRIGIFSMASMMPYFFNGSFRAEEIDYLTGELTGYSKAATFRTADMSGLDVIQHVARNLFPEIPDDERRETFRLPDTFDQMVGEGKLGNKSGEGFYKKVRTEAGKEYKVINPETLEYESQKEPRFESAAEAEQSFVSPEKRLKYLVEQEDEAGQFLWKVQSDLLLYAAHRVPEITDSVEAIDRAMKWGFNWELGPFERWDAIGVGASVQRMQQEGREVPDSVLKMLDSGRRRFYDSSEGTVYNLATGEVDELSAPAEGVLQVPTLEKQGREVFGNDSAGLYDLGEGIALFEFRTPRHTLGFELMETLATACEVVRDRFEGLVISHDGDHFTYGANLKEAMQAWNRGEKERVKKAVQNFQEVAVGLRYQPFPVVVAPFGRALGGGVELMLHADRVVAHYELYAGLVEVGAGLLPAGGGIKEMLYRAMQQVKEDEQVNPLPYIKEAFKTVGMAKVSGSAPEARELGFLRASDQIIMNRDRLLSTAKIAARRMADDGYHPPRKPKIKVWGNQALSSLKMMLYMMKEAGYIEEFDRAVAERVARVMSGGELSEPQDVPEDYLLKLEREAFLELLEGERTRERIAQVI